MANRKQTLYDILGVPGDALGPDIELAYARRLAELQKAMPQDPSALALLRDAHEVLGNPHKRAAYDASLVTAAERAAAREQEPDLVVEPDEAAKHPRIPAWAWVAAGVVAVIALFFALRTGHEDVPKPVVVAAPPPPPPPPTLQPKAPKDILAQALPNVGRVQSFEPSGRAVPLGLALAIGEGAMVTTCHGIPAGSQLLVTIQGENQSASLATTDELLDLCRLTVAALHVPEPTLVRGDPPPGEKVYVIGANAGGELALTEGEVKRTVPDPRGRLIEVSMPIAPNGSGGAVFDRYGRVLGIATTATYGDKGSFALPASWIGEMRTRTR